MVITTYKISNESSVPHVARFILRHCWILLIAGIGRKAHRPKHDQYIPNSLSNKIKQLNFWNKSHYICSTGQKRWQFCTGYGNKLSSSWQVGNMAGETGRWGADACQYMGCQQGWYSYNWLERCAWRRWYVLIQTFKVNSCNIFESRNFIFLTLIGALFPLGGPEESGGYKGYGLTFLGEWTSTSFLNYMILILKLYQLR